MTVPNCHEVGVFTQTAQCSAVKRPLDSSKESISSKRNPGKMIKKEAQSTEVDKNDSECSKVKETEVLQLTGISARDARRKALYKALGEEDSYLGRAPRLAREIETHIFLAYKDNASQITTQIRALCHNLKDIRNPDFKNAVLEERILAKELATITSAQMASRAKQQQRKEILKECMSECESDWQKRHGDHKDGMFQCNRCKSKKTTYQQLQTRSADEPLTTYVCCLNCGKQWRS